MIAVKVPPELHGFLRLGTSSWKYDSWKGLVYEPDKRYRPDDYLRDYARVLDSVEVDQWFYSLFPARPRLPDPRIVGLYETSVPEGFIFTVKAPNALTLTHFHKNQPAGYAAFADRPNPYFLDEALLGRFLERLSPLGPKLGPLIFQFEYLNKKKMPSAEEFIDRFGAFIRKAPGGFRYALEIRNANYYSPDFFKFLKENGLGFAYIDGYHLPPIGKVFEDFAPETADFQIIRLHGGDRPELEGEAGQLWNEIVAPKPEGLAAAAKIVRANAGKNILTYVSISNHYEGSAPLSIGRFLKILGTESGASGGSPR